jgi:1-acyl-sn-glycerol-3-phosphate acyltransferase
MNRASIDVPYSRRRAAWRLPAILAWTAVLLVPSVTTRLLTGRASRTVIGLWYRGCCRLLGLEIETIGRPETTGPVLVVANHVSYLDILIIGGLLKAQFIAKSEVRAWPGIGFLASLAGTIFVERRARRSRQQRDMIGASLAAGDSLVLFAEGTSSDGSRVLPFKSSLFGVFETGGGARGLGIQPVTIDYARLRDGRPIEGESRDLYAWHGDMSLAPHLGQVIGLPGAQVRLIWHETIWPTAFDDRKTLARRAQQAVAAGMARLRGRAAARDGEQTPASADAA